MFEDMPQEWSAVFFYVVVPELKQAQSSRESDGRNEGTPDKKVDDQGDEWHDVCLPLKHQENHNDVVEKCEDKLGKSISLERERHVGDVVCAYHCNWKSILPIAPVRPITPIEVGIPLRDCSCEE